MCSLQEFETVLRNLTVADNGIRKQAEDFLEQARSNANWLVPALLETIKGSQDAVVQQMSTVLLRRFSSKSANSVYDKLSEEMKAKLKAELLQLLGAQSSNIIRKGVAHCAAGLAIRLLAGNEWPELFPHLFTLVKGSQVDQQEAAMLVFMALAAHIPDNMMASTYTTFKDVCAHALSQPDTRVKTAGAETAMAMIQYLTVKQHVETFRALLPGLIQAIGQALSQGDVESATRCVDGFILVAEVTPDFFSKHLKEVFAPFLQIASQDDMDENLRRLALEFTITVAENDARTVKKVPNFMQTIVPLAMKMQLSVDHDKDWNTTSSEDDDEVTDFDVGIEAMDRLALALGGRLMNPVASPAIAQFLQSGDWKCRQAGLISLGQIAKGCKKEFAPMLAQIAPLLAKGFEDAHERVRHAAITATGQFCTDFSPEFQHQFHGVFLPALMKSMADPSPRVAAHAAQACINFLSGANTEDTEQYLDALLTALLQLLQSSQIRFVSESVVTAISSTAEHAEKLFSKYYGTIMPWLKNVVNAPSVNKPDRMLRAKSLECLSRVALAVGKEMFAPDAQEVLGAMARMQSTKMENDDPQITFLQRAWGRMAEVLGKDFATFVPMVIPPLLQTAAIETDVTITDEEGQEKEEGVESITIALGGMGEKRMSVRTSELEEKTLAMAVLQQIAEACTDLMAPYCEQLLTIVVPLLKFIYVEDVRQDAAALMPLIVKSLASTRQNQQMMPGLVQNITNAMIEAIKLEPNHTVKAAQLLALGQVFDNGPHGCLGSGAVLGISALMKKAIQDGLEARAKLLRRKKNCEDEDENEDEIDEDISTEEDCICQAVDVLTTLLKTEKADFQPFFEKSFFPLFAGWIGGAHSLLENRLGLCVCACYLEHHGNGAAAQHIPNIAQVLLQNCRPNHEDPDVAQVACYGLGVGLEVTKQGFQPYVGDAVTRLVAMVQTNNKKEEWESCVCNATAALLKAVEHQSGQAGVSAEALLPVILSAMPVKGDEEEGQYVNAKFVALLESQNAVLLGPNNSNMAGLLNICKAIKDTSFVDEETNAKLKTMLQ